MPDREAVATHYANKALLDRIEAGMDELGLTRDTVSIEDLGPVDEFHIGGRIATNRFLNAMAIMESDHVLDIGCGLGGAGRFAAEQFKCRVTGVDLTDEYVNAGRELCEWLGLGKIVQLEQGDATNTALPDDEFDKAFMLHVGMNIADKVALFSEIGRLLRPGGTLGVYDIMQTNSGDLAYPMPWATTTDESAVESSDVYRHALQTAGFDVISVQSRHEFALDFFAEMQTKLATAGGPPPLGLHITMGEDAPTKLGNMIQGIAKNRIAPIEILARLPE